MRKHCQRRQVATPVNWWFCWIFVCLHTFGSVHCPRYRNTAISQKIRNNDSNKKIDVCIQKHKSVLVAIHWRSSTSRFIYANYLLHERENSSVQFSRIGAPRSCPIPTVPNPPSPASSTLVKWSLPVTWLWCSLVHNNRGICSDSMTSLNWSISRERNSVGASHGVVSSHRWLHFS